ncbi:MAG: bifunctional diaminohydroxyphosphoribosylaminopyrimidine deaminase/5-amino-6-(5-phosphoribosylamino)uracil reductase RibD [Nitriliruptoraceae bacterium]|nr:bifunctional diaminohydroxyphosphoribosylaminopyrimidine deaminase/5-amino-6-(5-phosphoribosylamino)uracil reductase RibD [Nitriliruptoraceae bacterium]
MAALKGAGTRERGATVLVTLEPCAHQGRTPPCTGALLDAGVRRVVIAHEDPNPLAAGGAGVLRRAGVEVVGPLAVDDRLHRAVAGQLEGFLTVCRTGRPHVTLKLAQTLDGALVAPAGARWVTGPAARRAVHRWRAARDGVLVGSGTATADDPRLDARDVPVTTPPRAVVLDARGRTPPSARVVRPGTVLVTGPAPAAGATTGWRAAGSTVRTVAAGEGGTGVDLPAALRVLAEEGLTSLLAEPGRILATALLRADLVDRLVVHLAPHLGEPPLRGVVDVPLPPTPPGPGWWTERIGGAGPDLIVHLARVR